MVKKKINNNTNKNNNFLTNFKLFDKINSKWDLMFNFCINYFQEKNYSKNIINITKTFQNNKTFCLILFLFISWFWSSLVLSFVYLFMFIDSIVISLLILQNNCIKINSRRLAKNVILMTLTSLNLIGGILTLLLVLFIYMEYSKFFGRLIFKFIKFFIKITGNIFPPVYMLYPDIKLFNFEDPDMTVNDNSNKKNIKLYKPSSSSYSDESNSLDVSSSFDSSDSETYIIETHDKNKKSKIKHKSKNNIKSLKKKYIASKSFPSISTIKFDVFNKLKK